MMKHIVHLWVFLFLFVSCGQKDSANTIEFWMPPFASDPNVLDKTVWKDIIRPFEEQHNVKVNVTIVPWDGYEEKYLSSITAGQGPDIGYLYDELLLEFYKLRVLVPLDPYLSEEAKETFIYLKDGQYQDQQLTLPMIVGNPRFLVYNKNLVESVGETTPTTWDDFIRIAQKITKDLDGDGKADQWGAATPWGDSHFGIGLNDVFFPLLYQAGGSFVSEDRSRITLDTPEGLRALTFIDNIYNKYNLHPRGFPTRAALKETFIEGKIGFFFTHPAETSAIEAANVPFEWDYILALKDKYAYAPYVVDSLFMMSSVPEEKRQLVADLMVYILSTPSMEKFHKELSAYFPITKDAQYLGNPLFERILTKQADSLKLRDERIQSGARIYDILLKNIQRMLNKEITPKEVAQIVEREGNRIIQDNQ